VVVTTGIAGDIQWDPHHPELLSQSSEIFIALVHCNNSDPKEEVSTDVCFLLKKQIRQQLIHTRKSVLDLLVTESEA
jgi:hypothetical protein